MKLTLTNDELHILRQVADGKTLPSIALESGFSKKQAEQCLKSVYKKLHTENPVEALQKLAQTSFTVAD
jgi:DNA-binding NarL/FixJ family response regulator